MGGNPPRNRSLEVLPFLFPFFYLDPQQREGWNWENNSRLVTLFLIQGEYGKNYTAANGGLQFCISLPFYLFTINIIDLK